MGLDRARGRGRGLEVAEPPISALSPANETVGRGYYAPTTLSGVDGDLAPANIKNGITMFGFAGSADVHDISDATAIEAEVITGETFYAVSGGIRTGTMPIVALAPGSSAYPAGYHVGNVGGLPAIDGDLVTASIKNGITIFNVVGHVDVRNVSDANAILADVKAGRTFYAVGGARKTGNLATVALNPALNAYPAGYHVGAANLTAVDAHLVAANIANGIVIFGVTGTLVAGALAEDLVDSAITTHLNIVDFPPGHQYTSPAINPGNELEVVAETSDYDADSITVAVGHAFTRCSAAGTHKLDLQMDGVLVASSAFFNGFYENWIVVGTRALSGSKICRIVVHNYDVSFIRPYYLLSSEIEAAPGAAAIGVGSIKLV